MFTHIVARGECLASIAARYQMAWRTIYEAPENEAVRKKRPNPNVLYPGDQVAIPENRRDAARVETGHRHRFQIATQQWVLRLSIRDDQMSSLEGVPFRLTLPDGRALEGETSAGGIIEARVTAETRSAVLTIMGRDYRLAIGDLDPIERVTGIQQRLRRLGYDPGPVDGVVGRCTISAVRTFKARQGLDETGVIDDPTRARLLRLADDDTRMLDAEEDMSCVDPGQDGTSDSSEAADASGEELGGHESMEDDMESIR